MKFVHSTLVLLLLLALAVPAWCGEGEIPRNGRVEYNGVVRVGDKAPDFKLTALDGAQVCLTDCLGHKATLLVFWSFFCFPCRAEMPNIQEFYAEAGKNELEIVAISLDSTDYDGYVRPFIEESKVTFPVVYDNETEEFYETAERYGVVGTPTFFVLDEDGVVRFIHLGRLEKSVLEGIVKSVQTKGYCAEIIKPGLGAPIMPAEPVEKPVTEPAAPQPAD